MTLRSLLISTAGMLIWPSFAIAQSGACTLPQSLQNVVANRYPSAELVTLADLDEEERTMFQRDHRKQCPGAATVDFYGDGKPTMALVLVSRSGTKESAQLVVAHKVGHEWRTAALDKADSSVPVVWRQAPGLYEDVYGEKRIRATRPVIVFCGYNSWAVLYAWTGSRVTKLWLAD